MRKTEGGFDGRKWGEMPGAGCSGGLGLWNLLNTLLCLLSLTVSLIMKAERVYWPQFGDDNDWGSCWLVAQAGLVARVFMNHRRQQGKWSSFLQTGNCWPSAQSGKGELWNHPWGLCPLDMRAGVWSFLAAQNCSPLRSVQERNDQALPQTVNEWPVSPNGPVLQRISRGVTS